MFDEFFRRLLSKRVLYHAIFWAVNIAFGLSVPFYSEDKTLAFYAPRVILIFALLAIAVYTNLLYLIPKYLRVKKYWTYLLGVLIVTSVFAFLKIYIKLGVLKDPIDESLSEEISTAIVLPIIYIFCTSFLKFFREWISYQDIALRLKEAKNEKLEAELKVLKAQLNPHFMFNTLNNIYSLSLDRSDLTPGAILKLSDILSFTIYDSKADKVLVKDEIKFINNYLELEKIRIEETANIEFMIEGIYENLKIAPLLFMPLIENAFKHGINQRPENPYIKMHLEFRGNGKMKFVIENNTTPEIPEVLPGAHGIGIENVRKRLNLIYPGRHKLEIKEISNTFEVILILDLNH